METADKLDGFVDNVKQTAERLREIQARAVQEAIEIQGKEVAEPAREGEAIEQTAADRLADAAGRDSRFTQELGQAAETRNEAKDFLKEIADQDTEHQEQSQESLEEHERQIHESLEGMKKFKQ